MKEICWKLDEEWEEMYGRFLDKFRLSRAGRRTSMMPLKSSGKSPPQQPVCEGVLLTALVCVVERRARDYRVCVLFLLHRLFNCLMFAAFAAASSNLFHISVTLLQRKCFSTSSSQSVYLISCCALQFCSFPEQRTAG